MTSAKLACLLVLAATPQAAAQPLERIRVSDDRSHFVGAESGERFVVWGVNYDHDSAGRLLDEYWVDEWRTVVQDFQEIKQLGANCVRVHLQLGKFMQSPDQPDPAALAQLGKLVKLAEQTGLYLDVTGLACYHKKNIPPWYDALPEAERWDVQARFWRAVAGVCTGSPAVFCYDLMNEPLLPGAKAADDWLGAGMGDKFFVQRISLDAAGRAPKQVGRAWVDKLVDAIREHDPKTMVTVGVIPWVLVFGGGQPTFHSAEIGERLDFVAVHFYPERGKIEQALTALRAYELGKPLVIEEIFPLKASSQDLREFIRRSSPHADGWISFYWGEPAAELKKQGTLSAAVTAGWMEEFARLAPQAKAGRLPPKVDEGSAD